MRNSAKTEIMEARVQAWPWFGGLLSHSFEKRLEGPDMAVRRASVGIEVSGLLRRRL